MRRLRRCRRPPAVQHRINEVPMVVVRNKQPLVPILELHRPKIRRPALQLVVLGKYPALAPDELHPPLRRIRRAEHHHPRPLLITILNPERFRRIVNPLLTTLHLRRHNLHRRRLILPRSPLRHIQKMRPPIRNVPRRIHIHPPEIEMTPRRRVRSLRSRPLPHLIIKPSRHRLRCLHPRKPTLHLKRPRHPHLDLLQLPDITIPHPLAP